MSVLLTCASFTSSAPTPQSVSVHTLGVCRLLTAYVLETSCYYNGITWP